MTTERYKKIGFPYITNIGYFAIMIPTPKLSTNVAAVWQPFQLSVSSKQPIHTLYRQFYKRADATPSSYISAI